MKFSLILVEITAINYLSYLRYLNEFDDFLKYHIKIHANCGFNRSNYLSYHTCRHSTYCTERYFPFTLDSTPDVANNNQLAIIFMYVTANSDIREAFISFINII